MSVPTQFGLRYRSLAMQFVIAVVLAVLCLPCAAFAATFSDLYTINLALQSSSMPTQNEATRVAMGRLLTRITGRPDAARELIFLNLLDKAEDFVLEIGRLDRDTLTVTFNEQSIERELRSLDQPVWGPERPLTLIWVAVDAGLGRRSILSGETSELQNKLAMTDLDDRLRQEIFRTAYDRGLPIAFPLLDLEDMASLAFVDVWGGFNDRIREASVRYKADAILSGRVRVSEFGDNVQWTLIWGDWESGITTATLGEGLDRVAEIYAEEFGAIGRSRPTQITVLGVTESSHYFEVLSYMDSLSFLESVKVEQYDPTGLLLRITWRGDLDLLQRMLDLGNVLIPANTMGTKNGERVPNNLAFRLLH